MMRRPTCEGMCVIIKQLGVQTKVHSIGVYIDHPATYEGRGGFYDYTTT